MYSCRRHGGLRLCISRLSRRNGGACIEGALPGHNRFDTIMQGAIALGPKTDGFGKDKAAILKRRRCLNPRPGDVADHNFVSDNPFFDARDLIQVKYEMLRRVERDGESVAGTSAVFGLSRPSFYNAMRAFRSEGMEGLAAKPPGPRGPHKLTEELMAFVEQVLAENGSIRPSRLAALIRDAFGVSVHPRSIDRALRRKKKRDPHPSAETGPVQPG